MNLERTPFTPPPSPLSQELKKPIESLKPEPLSNERIGDLLAGFGNSESKATTLLILAKEKRPLTLMDLYNELMDVQEEGGWKINKSIPFSYCTNSLAPIGLVAKEIVDEERRIYGYEITPDGEKIGVPFAGLLLDWSLRYPEFSLYRIFGSTQSSGKTKETKSQSEDTAMLTHKNRSPGTVLQILQAILTREQPIRLSDLEADIEKQNITTHLFELDRGGIITYQTSQNTIEGKPPIVFYSLSENKLDEEALPIYDRTKILTHDVYEIYKEHVAASLSAQDVMKLLIEKNQKYSQLKQRSLRSQISNILRFLSKKGHLINTTDFSTTRKTDISLNGKQRQALTDLVNIILAFQKQDSAIIAFGEKRAREIKSDPESVSKLMRKAKENSSHAERKPIEETALHIKKILKHKPEGMTIKEIQEELKKQFEIKLSVGGTRSVLKELFTEKEGLSVQKIEDGNVYFLGSK